MRRNSRAYLASVLVLILIEPAARPRLLLAEVGEFSGSVPLTYALPARGMSAGSGLTEIVLSTYSLYASPSPSAAVAAEEQVLSTRFRVSISIADRLHLWVEPQVRRLRWTLRSGDRITEMARADTWLGARFCPPIGESLIRLGIAGMVLLPTGRDDAGGRPGDFTAGGADYAVMGLCDFDLSRLFGSHRCVVYLNCGYRWHRNETDESRVWPDVYPAVLPGEGAGFNDQLLLRLGWRYTASGVSLESEFRGDQFVNARDWIGWRENPVSLNAGLRKWVGQRYWVRVGGEVALSSGGPETAQLADPERAFPDWVIVASVGGGWNLF